METRRRAVLGLVCLLPALLLAGVGAAPTPPSFTRGPQDFGVVRAFGVALADVDRDGDLDLFVANYIGRSKLWLNDGAGVFKDSGQGFEAAAGQCAHDVALADLDGDARPDAFLVCHNAPSRIFLNDGTGRLADSGQELGTADDDPQSVVLGDIDGDGDVDAFLLYSRRPNRLWLNDGRGRFFRTNDEFGGRSSPVMTLADFDGDGLVDLFQGFLEQPGEIRLNDGRGGFPDARPGVGERTGCDAVVSGDLDGDGDTDLAVASVEAGVGIWLNRDGAGSFTRCGDLFAAGTLRAELFDADGDGDLDLLAAHIQQGNRLWLNDGAGRFAPTDRILGATWAFSFAVGRVNADDAPDVALGNEVDGRAAAAVYFHD